MTILLVFIWIENEYQNNIRLRANSRTDKGTSLQYFRIPNNILIMIISALEDKQRRHDIKSGSKKESKD